MMFLHRLPSNITCYSRDSISASESCFPSRDGSHAIEMSEASISYGGACPRCRTRHSLSVSAEAVKAAQHLNKLLYQHKRLDFEVPEDGHNPLFSTDYLWTKGPGRMLGVMMACDPDCDCSESSHAAGSMVTLKAFSGQFTESWNIPG